MACAALMIAGCSSTLKGANMPMSSSRFPLPSAKLCAFAATTDAARCRDFYVGKLGLRLMHEDGYGIVLDSGGTMVRIQKGPELTPVPRTVLGWNVVDIEQTVKSLVMVGVTFERFTWFKQDENGITTFP